MKILKRVLIVLGLLILASYAFICWSLSGRVLFPESSLEKTKSRIVQYWGTTYEASMATMPPAKDFAVKSNDGLNLSGKYFATSDSSTCVIIFAHGWGAMWADMLKYVTVFSECNCDYVMYDHRAHGNSDGIFATGGIKEADDLWKITDWILESKGINYSQVGWIGSSWGAATTIIAASDSKNVGFVIADSPFQNWNSAVFERAIRDYGNGIKMISPGVMKVVSIRAGVDLENSALNKASKIDEPILLIHSKGDKQTSSTQSVNVSKNLKPGISQFFHTEWGNDHVMDVINNTEEYRKYVNEFLKEKAPQFLKPIN